MSGMSSAICARRLSGELLENAVELGKGLEPNLERDLADPKIEIMQEAARLFEAGACDVFDKIYAGDLLKLLAEMIPANVGRFRNLTKRKLFSRMLLDELSRLPDLHGFGSMA
jgi:hypothetical protein